jgi:RHS repeat-associated protein
MRIGPDLTDPAKPATREITYNADNMPTRITHSAKGGTDIVYDGESERAKKTTGKKTTLYISNAFEIINGVKTTYIFAGNLRIAKRTAAGITFFHKDHLGSSTVMTNNDSDSTQVKESTEYLPYGSDRLHTGAVQSNYKFTDQERDTSTGLYNYNARLYDPVIGRFVSADGIVPYPYDPQSLNRYSYVYNNPLGYTDPSGHMGDSAALAAAEEDRDIENSDNPGGWTLSNSGNGSRITDGGIWNGVHYYNLSHYNLIPRNQSGGYDVATLGIPSIGIPSLSEQAIKGAYSPFDFISIGKSVGPLAAIGYRSVIKGGVKSASKSGVTAGKSGIKGLGNIGSHSQIKPGDALKHGQTWLGRGYKEIGPKGSGVFRSADGTRQFRMTSGDLNPKGHGAKSGLGSHVHFEALDARGRIIENLHIPLKP